MFPLRDNIRAGHPPMVNVWLIIVNVICFLYELRLGAGLQEFIKVFGFTPALFLARQQAAGLDPAGFLPVISSMFLHGGWLHLISNMWMLWIFGDNVEDSMGHGRYLAFYLCCGIASVFSQAWLQPHSLAPMLGASGAISGVLGAYFLLYPRARVLTLIPVFIFIYPVEIPAFFFLGIWFVMQLIQGWFHSFVFSLTGGGIAWWAHVGGFGAGLLLIPFFKKRKRSMAGIRG